ncbi:MAG: aldo/keto reductase, partial [Bacteroidota bacterium]
MPQQAPILILGTAMWGWTTSPQQCFALLDYFYEAGFREIDAATNYPINKNPADFRKSEQILLEWIKANGINDLKVMIKVGSVNNLRTPEHNLQKSFLLVMLDEYRYLFGDNLDTFMIHWDNREDEQAIHASYEALQQAQQLGFRVGLSGIKHPAIHAKVNEQFQLDVRIQFKHNLLYSDYQRYAPFHGKQRFITYGINAGGLKLSPNA